MSVADTERETVLLDQDAVDELIQPLLPLVDLDHVLLGCQAGRRVEPDPAQEDRTETVDEIGGGPFGRRWVRLDRRSVV